uniref:RNA-dependent RNA polymerase n=1 Tax=Grapevine-associated mitovirus 5 TaxID=2814318 RepID=A0A8F5MKM1_9VIRU|nr:MAG: RNA-dependent RNA polymerase [Grapevine-associated mitovirus 5]
MDIVSQWQVSKSKLILSKLSLKPEPAGKVRVFAILDVWSQSVLKPIHDHIFEILKSIPNDGCFDQIKPLQRLMLKGHKNVFSFDLSAATDRLPILLQTQVMSWLYGQDVALAWKTLLIDRDYFIKTTDLAKYGTKSDIIVKESDRYEDGFNLRYAVGQPMGALSSWGVFSLTHHIIIQYCARQAGFKSWFDDYALLGDDVVIANKEVADLYLFTMTKVLGVEINLSKSLISNNGTAEFAKQLVSGTVNYTPVGAKNIAQSLKNFANFPSILRDYILKGGIVDNADLQRLIGSLSYNIVKTSKKNLSSLLWVIMGPFGFLNTGENRFKPELFAQSGIPLSPYDLRLRTLSYALDWLIIPIKEVLREDYAKDWKASVEKSAKVLKSYRDLITVKGFVCAPVPLNLLPPVDVNLQVNPHPMTLPSYRSLLLVSMEKFEELLGKEEPSLNVPYSLPFVEGMRYMLSNIDWPIPETNLLRNQPLIKPRFRPTNKAFFIKVRKQLIKLVKEHEKNAQQEV